MAITVTNNQSNTFYPHFPLNMTISITAPDKVYGKYYTRTTTAIPVKNVGYYGSTPPTDYSQVATGDYWINTYPNPPIADYFTINNNWHSDLTLNENWDTTTNKKNRVVFRWNNMLYGWHTSGGWLPIYQMCDIILKDDAGTVVWSSGDLDLTSTGSASVTCTYSPSDSTYSGKYRFVVRYMEPNRAAIACNTTESWNVEYSDWFEVYGKSTGSYANQYVTSVIPTYAVTNEDDITFEWNGNPSGSWTGVPLLKLDEKNTSWGVEWKMYFNGSILSLDAAVANGWIKVISQKSEYLHYLLTVKILQPGYGMWNIRAFYHLNTNSDDYAYMPSSFSMYNRPTPLITTAAGSIVPAQWVYNETHDNAHAVNGLPPYQVTFTDSSTYTNAVPVKKWSINFGDSASGVVNSLEYSNASGQQQTYHANSVHTFDGYGDYYVTLTLTDMTDKEHRYTYTFAPTKAHRFITNPLNAITPTSDLTVPQIMTCDVVVAGYPEPETSWTYAHTNGIYTATKEGQYAQFALSEGGLYTISFLSTQTGSSNLTISKNIVVSANSANTLSTDNPISQGDFITWLYVSGNRYCPIPVSTPIIRWNYADGKQLTFHVPLSWENLSYLRPGCLVSCGYNGIARPFVVYSRSNNQDTGYAEIQCYDYAQTLFDSRVATAATNSLSDNGYDVQTYYGESLMRYFAISNLGTGRSDSIFRRIGTDAHAGGTQTYSARYETISSIISDLCGNTQLGWDVNLQNSSGDVSYLVGWKPISGSDRSATVIFSEEFMTADIGVFTETVSPSVALGAGQGEGAARTYVEYDVSGGTPALTGINRREIFVDAGDAADSNEVKRMSVLELENGKQMTFYITPLPDSPYVFGTDYAVGDFVSIYDKSLSATPIKVRIKSAQYAQTSTGVKLELTCGTTQPSAWNLIQRNMQANTYARK